MKRSDFMFTDSHCHLYQEYYDDFNLLKENAWKNDVKKVINNGIDQKTNEEVLKYLEIYDYMYGAIGIHPECVHEYKPEDLDFIEKHLNDDKVIAIGEIGLDYHYEESSKNEQIELFESLLKLAEKYHKPVVIHSREATSDVINCLKKYKVKGVIHSFSGSLEDAQTYINMGFLLSINGVITFKNSNIKEVYEKIPLDKILLETDAPYLTPHPNRGKRNEPMYIKDIAMFVAKLKNISLEELSEVTEKNLKNMFFKDQN